MAQKQQPGDGEGDHGAGRDEAGRGTPSPPDVTAPTAALPATGTGGHTPGRGGAAPLGTVGDGRYRLTHRLGRGGMAEVLAAQDVRLGRTVAVKLLRPELAQDDIARLRFSREAQSVAGLNHHSIVAVYDTGEEHQGDESTPYIVMELVEGRTVRELLVDEEAPPVDQALIIIAGVLEALAYSHRHGIVHRDIKPANVIITTGGAVKVMDFGIARALTGAASTMTQTGMVMGTPQYLSPEQALGKAVDHRSDLYAAGCMLYELLTLRPPFTGDTPLSVVYQHVQDAPVPPSQANRRVPAGLDALVLRSLAKNPDDRFQDADEFRAHVQHALRQLHGAEAGYPGAAAAAAAAGLAAAGQGHGGAFPGPGTGGSGGYGGYGTPAAGTAATEPFGSVGRSDPTTALPYQAGSPYQTPSGPYQGPGGPNGGDDGGDDDDHRRGPWGWVAGVVAVLVAAGIGIAIAVQAGNNDNGDTPRTPAVTTTSAPEATQSSPSALPSPSATRQTQAPTDSQTFVPTPTPTRHSTPSPSPSPTATATKSPTATASPTATTSPSATTEPSGTAPAPTGGPPKTTLPPVLP
ncbi:protein kinase [Kitasatospora sp. NPDC057015]|uniref:protein kinase domain-containing protein n=1 Tax=Kitasatospora sp. NPDC057015 TaxID=3346001 RepID=UPI003636893B